MGKALSWLLVSITIIFGLVCGASGRLLHHHGLHTYPRLLSESSPPANTSANGVLGTIATWLAPARALSDAADCGTLDCQIERGVCLPRVLDTSKRCLMVVKFVSQGAQPHHRCRLARESPACTDGNQFVEYLPLWFCSTPTVPQWTVGAGFVIWALLLFYCMSTIAEAFLVPAVQVRGWQYGYPLCGHIPFLHSTWPTRCACRVTLPA